MDETKKNRLEHLKDVRHFLEEALRLIEVANRINLEHDGCNYVSREDLSPVLIGAEIHKRINIVNREIGELS